MNTLVHFFTPPPPLFATNKFPKNACYLGRSDDDDEEEGDTFWHQQHLGETPISPSFVSSSSSPKRSHPFSFAFLGWWMAEEELVAGSPSSPLPLCSKCYQDVEMRWAWIDSLLSKHRSCSLLLPFHREPRSLERSTYTTVENQISSSFLSIVSMER